MTWPPPSPRSQPFSAAGRAPRSSSRRSAAQRAPPPTSTAPCSTSRSCARRPIRCSTRSAMRIQNRVLSALWPAPPTRFAPRRLTARGSQPTRDWLAPLRRPSERPRPTLAPYPSWSVLPFPQGQKELAGIPLWGGPNGGLALAASPGGVDGRPPPRGGGGVGRNDNARTSHGPYSSG